MFNGNENHDITLAEAAALTKRYRDQMNSTDRKGGFFGKEKLLEILNQTDCVGIRYYYGLDRDNKQVLVLTGVLAIEKEIRSLRHYHCHILLDMEVLILLKHHQPYRLHWLKLQ